MIGFIFILFFSQHRWMILLAEIMQGVPWGVFETMPVAYASEISPMVLRPYITTYANLCWVMGQLIASGVLRGCLTMEGEPAYRVPMALQWIWPVPIVLLMYFAPESPCWLARKGRLDNARCSLKKLTDFDTEEIENHLDLIKHTVLLEKKNDHDDGASQTIWGRMKNMLGPCRDCFQGVDRRRTEISCGAWVCQSLCGSNLMAFAPYFFEKAGLQSDTSFTIQLVTLSLGAGGTVFAWILMNHVGRRRIYVLGLWSLFVLLLVIGLLAAAANAPGVPWAVSILVSSIMISVMHMGNSDYVDSWVRLLLCTISRWAHVATVSSQRSLLHV
jgi:SP family general alpha glucoside:H+ symporter-like MFS transporter